MNLLNGLLGNLDEISAKLGLPADKLQALAQSVQDKMSGGGDLMSAITQSAQEHGVSLESLKGLIGGAEGGMSGLIAKAGSALDKDGDGNPLNDLGEMAKGLFGKS